MNVQIKQCFVLYFFPLFPYFLIDNRTKNSLFCFLHLFQHKKTLVVHHSISVLILIEELLSSDKNVHNAAPTCAVANAS